MRDPEAPLSGRWSPLLVPPSDGNSILKVQTFIILNEALAKNSDEIKFFDTTRIKTQLRKEINNQEDREEC